MKLSRGEPRRRRLRFSLAAILGLTACVCCFLAGRTQGYREAMSGWESLPTLGVYQVSDLLVVGSASTSGEPPYDELISEIQSAVVPLVWIGRGGNCDIIPFEQNRSLIVLADSYVHERLAEYLEEVRSAELAGR